jgi:hypothetical protein
MHLGRVYPCEGTRQPHSTNKVFEEPRRIRWIKTHFSSTTGQAVLSRLSLQYTDCASGVRPSSVTTSKYTWIVSGCYVNQRPIKVKKYLHGWFCRHLMNSRRPVCKGVISFSRPSERAFVISSRLSAIGDSAILSASLMGMLLLAALSSTLCMA